MERGDEMLQRAGRPPTGKARVKTVETRMSEIELERLDYCCEMTGKTKSEIIRIGVNVLYAQLKQDPTAAPTREPFF